MAEKKKEKIEQPKRDCFKTTEEYYVAMIKYYREKIKEIKRKKKKEAREAERKKKAENEKLILEWLKNTNRSGGKQELRFDWALEEAKTYNKDLKETEKHDQAGVEEAISSVMGEPLSF